MFDLIFEITHDMSEYNVYSCSETTDTFKQQPDLLNSPTAIVLAKENDFKKCPK